MVRLPCLAVAIGAIAVISLDAVATSRRFPWLYETRVLAEGEVEYEQWVTWKTDKASDDSYREIKLRHEIEWGATDQLQLALYLPDWRYKQSNDVARTQFRDIAMEAIYQLTAPGEDQWGSALYGEIKIGDELMEIEGKLLLQRDLGQWTFVYNLVFEAEWEGQHYDQDKGKIEHAFALGWQADPSLSIGAQLIWEMELPDLEDTGDSVVYLGPSIAIQKTGWWLSASPIFQVTDELGEPDMQVRLLVGLEF